MKQCLALGRSLKTSKAKVTTQLSKSSDSKFLPRLRKQHTPHPRPPALTQSCRPLPVVHPYPSSSPSSLHTPTLWSPCCSQAGLSYPHACPAFPATTSKEAPDGLHSLTQTHNLAANPFLAHPPVGLLQLHKGLLFCKQGVTMSSSFIWNLLCRSDWPGTHKVPPECLLSAAVRHGTELGLCQYPSIFT